MEFKTLYTGNISYLEAVEGSSRWLWGSDFTSGDLYEAEELYTDHHRIRRNRLIFVNCEETKVYEPICAKDGQYFGMPVFEDGKLMILLADFPANEVRIISFDPREDSLETEAVISRKDFRDCYNLRLQRDPLLLTRSSGDAFEIIWPYRKSYVFSATETFCFMREGKMYTSRWYEDPDYREETLIRDSEDGHLIETIPASLLMCEGGEWMILRHDGNDDEN